jgi:hypothetical protein
MKKIIFISLFLPTLLFAQLDSTKRTFKISIPNRSLLKEISDNKEKNRDTGVVILSNNIIHDTISLTSFYSSPLDSNLRCSDSAKIFSFDLTIGVNGIYQTIQGNPGHFKPQALQSMGMAPQGSSLFITNILYKSSNGKTRSIKGIACNYYYFKIK